VQPARVRAGQPDGAIAKGEPDRDVAMANVQVRERRRRGDLAGALVQPPQPAGPVALGARVAGT
jgi:hypothetical protein